MTGAYVGYTVYSVAGYGMLTYGFPSRYLHQEIGFMMST